MSESDAQAVLDARGLKCPLPVLKLRKRLKAISAGETIEVMTDDPAAAVDVPFYCMESGHELVSQDQNDGGMRFVVRKSG